MKHKGKVTSTIDNGYASFLILKNAQWSSGRIKTNFNFNDKNTELSALLRKLFGKTFDECQKRKSDRSQRKNNGKPRFFGTKIAIEIATRKNTGKYGNEHLKSSA